MITENPYILSIFHSWDETISEEYQPLKSFTKYVMPRQVGSTYYWTDKFVKFNTNSTKTAYIVPNQIMRQYVRNISPRVDDYLSHIFVADPENHWYNFRGRATHDYRYVFVDQCDIPRIEELRIYFPNAKIIQVVSI